MIHWFQVTSTINTVTVSASSLSEFNIVFSLNSFNSFPLAGFTSLFDQYCLYCIVVNLNVNTYNNLITGYGRVTTAIDYDNVTNLGTEAALQDYASAQTVEIAGTTCVQRLLYPCVAPALYTASAFSAFGVSRSWVDTASPNAGHYGFRSIWDGNATGSTFPVDIIATAVIGGRNQI